MRDLERELHDLGTHWDAPATPDLANAVIADLPERPRRAVATRRRIRIALVCAAVALGAVAAIAPARDAVLDFFDFGAVRVSTDTPGTTGGAPTARPDEADLGAPATFDAARAAASFEVKIPEAAPLGAPDDVFIRDPGTEAIVTFVWRAPDGTITTLLSQARGTLLMAKFIDPSAPPQPVLVDGSAGYWFTGGPHTFGYLNAAGDLEPATTRLADNVLLWDRAGVTYRLEGLASLGASLRVARELR